MVQFKERTNKEICSKKSYFTYWLCNLPVPLGTAPTILTLVTILESENCGGGANTSSTIILPPFGPFGLVASVNSGGGGTTGSSLSSFSDSNGGGSWANETALRVKLDRWLDALGRVDMPDGLSSFGSKCGGFPGIWNNIK